MIEAIALASFTAGALCLAVIERALAIYRRREDQRARARAAAVLKEHGLATYLYLPTIGVEHPSVRQALDALTLGSHIVVDSDGRVLGRLGANAPRTKPVLRLVVSND